MSNDRKDHELENESERELLERLELDEREVQELELTEEQARSIVARGDDSLIGRAASMAIARVEREKDNPEAMGQEITRKYLDMGLSMLSDAHASPLDRGLRQRVMDIAGFDPGDVRIHTGERAQQAADALGTKAFAVGDSDVYFARDEFRPDTSEGLGVLVHELTHVADNQVAAAYHGGAGSGDYSAAEARADAAESAAVDYQESGDPAGQAEDGGPAKINMQELENAVAKLIERSRRLGADRLGVSATQT